MSNTPYNITDNIIVTDYTGDVNVLSSYDIPITPLQFKLESTVKDLTYITWFFGDGETSNEREPEHYYKIPGRYNVTVLVYDAGGQGEVRTEPVTVTIKNYIENNFKINTQQLHCSAGQLSNPLIVEQTLPVASLEGFKYSTTEESITETLPADAQFLPGSFRSDVLPVESVTINTLETTPVTDQMLSSADVDYNITGALSDYYFEVSDEKFNHLIPTHTLIKKEWVNVLSGYEFVPVPKITTPLSAVYAKVVDGAITSSLISDDSSIIVGYSGIDTFYLRDDRPSNSVLIRLSNRYMKHLNPFYTSLTGQVAENIEADHLSITSSGIDGDGGVSTSFDINKNKFSNTKIHFVVKVKDAFNNTIKSVTAPGLSSVGSGINVSLSSTSPLSGVSYSVTSMQNTLSSYNSGVFRGYIQIDDTNNEVLSNICIVANTYNLSSYLGTDIQNISGKSSYFNIYPNNYYTIYKKGEDFDGEAMYKGLRFSETLLDKEVFFGHFLKAIFGDANSDVEALGKKVYEKISNFVDNNSNIETADINKLLSMASMVDNRSFVFDNNLTSFPTKVSRAIALFSITQNKLFGSKNKFAKNFNKYSELSGINYGKNIGDQIDAATYTISAGTDIVAFGRFSKKYQLLNTYQPLSAKIPPTSSQYMLSSYNNTWGWPLVLAGDFSIESFNDYYDIFEYNGQYDNSTIGSILNEELTTIDFDTEWQDLVEDDGIYENILLNTFYSSLSLINTI